MSRATTLTVLRKTALHHPLLSAFIVLVIALLAALGAVAPVMLDNARSETIRAALRDQPSMINDLGGFDKWMPVVTNDADPWAGALAELEAMDAIAPAPVQQLTNAPRIATFANFGQFTGDDAPLHALILAATPGFDGDVTYLEGSAPAATPTDGVYDVVTSKRDAEALNWQIGEVRAGSGVSVRLSGIIEPLDDTTSLWSRVPNTLVPLWDPDNPLPWRAAVFLNESALPIFKDHVAFTISTVWFPLEIDKITTGNALALAADLRKYAAEPQLITGQMEAWTTTDILLTSLAPQAIDIGIERANAMVAVIATLAVGPIIVSLVALSLAARMLAQRRAPVVRLMRVRGASEATLARWLVIEATVLAGLGVALGAGAAIATFGWHGASMMVLPVVIGVAAIVLLPLLALTSDRGKERADLGIERGSRRWFTLGRDALLVVLAALIVASIATRAEPVSGTDPQLTLLPVALAVAATVLSLRILPPVLVWFERRGERSSSLVPLLGAARARRAPAIRFAPVMAVVVGLTIAMFSVAFTATVTTGVQTVARQQLGADIRISGMYLMDSDLDAIAETPGVAYSTSLRASQQSDLVGSGGRKSGVTVFAVNPDEFLELQRDMPDTALPLEPLIDAAGEHVPVIASTELSAYLDGDVTINGKPVVVAGMSQPVSPFAPNVRKWVIVDRARLGEIVRNDDSPTFAFVRLEADADPAAVRDAIAQLLPDATVEAVSDVEQRRLQDPALGAIAVAVLAAIIVVAVMLAVSVGMALVLGARARSRLVATLRTVGYPPGSQLRLVAWEIAPPLLVALPFGIAAGVGVSYWAIGALDLSGFVGSEATPQIMFGGWWQVVVVAATITLATLAVLLATAVASRASSAKTLRSVDEEV